GSCADGVCCESACNGTCTTCNAPGSAGSCVFVTDGELAGPGHDPCASGQICRAGACTKREIAEPCSDAVECASGACVDGVCCDRPCGRCEQCAAPGSV